MANMHDNVERSVLEISEEGREIPMLTITDNPSIESIVLIDCGFHAREWITPAFCHYFVEEASDFIKLCTKGTVPQATIYN